MSIREAPRVIIIVFHWSTRFITGFSILPRYVGFLYVTGETKYFGTIEKIKRELRTQYDNKIVECTFNTKTLVWEIMRERTDKSVPNHISTAKGLCLIGQLSLMFRFPFQR